MHDNHTYCTIAELNKLLPMIKNILDFRGKIRTRDFKNPNGQCLVVGKVQIFWEGHKLEKNLPLIIWRYSVASNVKWKIFSNFVAFSEYLKFMSTLMPCPFTGPNMFCASPNFLSQPKNLTAFSASSKTFVLAQKPILLNTNHLFVWHKMFVTVAICK